MNTNLLLKDEEQERPVLKLIEGGKEPPTDNWLKELPEGSVFLATVNNQRTVDAQEWHVLIHTDVYTKLLSNINNEIKMWVNSLEFSRQMKLALVLGNE